MAAVCFIRISVQVAVLRSLICGYIACLGQQSVALRLMISGLHFACLGQQIGVLRLLRSGLHFALFETAECSYKIAEK